MDDGNGNPIPMTYGNGSKLPAGKSAGDYITFTTDDTGYVLIALDQTRDGAELEEGVHYYLKEISSPVGYQIDSSVEYWSFTLTKDPDGVSYGGRDAYGNRQWIYFYFDDILKMSNTQIPDNENIDLTVEKQWLEADGSATSDLSGYTAVVQLYRKVNDGDYKPIKVADDGSIIELSDGDASGQITLTSSELSHTWTDLPRSITEGSTTTYYDYEIREVGASSGDNSDKFVTTITSAETADENDHITVSYKVKNQKVEEKNINLSIEKKWYDESGVEIDAPEDSISFKLYRVVSKSPFAHQPSAGGAVFDYTSTGKNLPTGMTYDSESDEYTLPKSLYSGVTFADLPSVTIDEATGEATYYAYYVKETEMDEYDLSSSTTTTTAGDTTTTTVTLKNTEKPQPSETNLSVSKEWKWIDGTTIDPPSNTVITYRLYQITSETPIDQTKIDPEANLGELYDATNQWGGYEWNWYRKDVGTYQMGVNGDWSTKTFSNLPEVTVDSRGKATYYAYYVKEIGLDGTVEASYTLSKKDDGSYSILMTNTKGPEETELEVSKKWTVNGADYNNEGKTWPEDVKVVVTLYRNGTVVADKDSNPVTVTLDANNISDVFENLPKTDVNGNEYIYTVKEEIQNSSGETITTVDGKGVEAKIEKTDDGYQITNDLTTPGKLIVTKNVTGLASGSELTDEEKAAITFTVTGPTGFETKTKKYSEFTEKDGVLTWEIDDLTVFGDYTVTETGAAATVNRNESGEEVTYTRSTSYKVNNGNTVKGESATVALSSADTTVAFMNSYSKPSDGTGTIHVNKTWGSSVTKTPVSVSLYYKLIDSVPGSGSSAERTASKVHFKYNGWNESSVVSSEFYAKKGDDIQVILISESAFSNNFSLDSNQKTGVENISSSFSADRKTMTITFKASSLFDNQWNSHDIWIGTSVGGTDAPSIAPTITVQNLSASSGDDTSTPIQIDASLASNPSQGTAYPGYQNVTIDSTTGWSTTFTNLPIQNESGQYYQYFVVENGGEAYGATYSDNDTDTITVNNPNAPETTELSVEKKWNDQNGNDITQTYNGSADFELWQVKTTKGSSSVPGAGDVVKIKSTDSSCIISEVDGTLGNDIVLTFRVIATSDADKNDLRNSSNVRIYAGYSEYNNYSGNYSQKEYKPSLVSESGNEFIIKYVIPTSPSGLSFTPKSIELKGFSWKGDSHEFYGEQNYAGGEYAETETTTESCYATFSLSTGEWTKAFSNLPKKSADGKTTYSYYVKEINVPLTWEVAYSPAGTESTQSGSPADGTVTVTNTVPTPNTVTVNATKTWSDAGNTFAYHPEVTFTLYRKALAGSETAPTGDSIPRTAAAALEAEYELAVGNDYDTVKTMATNGTSVSWTGLPEKDGDGITGNTYAYVVIESNVPHYTLTNVSVTDNTYSFTNTLDEETTKLTVQKEWNINGKEVADVSSYPEIEYKVYQIVYNNAARTEVKTAAAEYIDLPSGVTKKLNNANSWTEVINGLPKMKYTNISEDGTFTAEYYSYYIEEQAITATGYTDYIVSYQVGDGPILENGSDGKINMGLDENTVTITNGKYEIDISILKVDKDNSSPLAGAKFKIEKYGTVWEAVNVTKNSDGDYSYSSSAAVTEVQVDANGKLTVKGLGNGIYRLVETEAPAGYVITNNVPALFTIAGGEVTPQASNIAEYQKSGDENIFIVPNEPGAALPSTGGPGTRLFTILGLVLIAGAGVLLLRRRRTI